MLRDTNRVLSNCTTILVFQVPFMYIHVRYGFMVACFNDLAQVWAGFTTSSVQRRFFVQSFHWFETFLNQDLAWCGDLGGQGWLEDSYPTPKKRLNPTEGCTVHHLPPKKVKFQNGSMVAEVPWLIPPLRPLRWTHFDKDVISNALVNQPHQSFPYFLVTVSFNISMWPDVFIGENGDFKKPGIQSSQGRCVFLTIIFCDLGTVPIPSMGLVCLPTWMVDFYGKCR